MTEAIRSRDDVQSRPAYPEIPEPLEIGTYDNHAHLEIEDGNPSLSVAEQLQLMRQAGMLGAVQVGVTLESSQWSAAVARSEPMLLAAVAIHPNEAPEYGDISSLDDAIAEIALLCEQPRVRAVGETGLDFYRTQGEGELALQLHSFQEHIAVAKSAGVALQIHDRDAHEAVIKTLDRVGAPERVVFHCFSGDVELARVCRDRGWYASFAGNITFKRNQYLRDALAELPPELILVETDSPFLTPEPLRGRPNAPYLVPHTLRYMASLMETSASSLARQISENTERVYGDWQQGLA